jgi:hypothetical protein
MAGSSCYTSWSSPAPALNSTQAKVKCSNGSIPAQLETWQEAEQVGPFGYGISVVFSSSTPPLFRSLYASTHNFRLHTALCIAMHCAMHAMLSVDSAQVAWHLSLLQPASASVSFAWWLGLSQLQSGSGFRWDYGPPAEQDPPWDVTALAGKLVDWQLEGSGGCSVVNASGVISAADCSESSNTDKTIYRTALCERGR